MLAKTAYIPSTGVNGNRPDALVVVAHWDDEIIAAWGAMTHLKCTVICLTDKHSAQYERIFEQIVASVEGEPQSWKCPIRQPSARFTQLCNKENISRLAEQMRRKDYRFCFTHHFNCDIGGHPQHAMTARLAYSALRLAGLQDRIKLFGFGTHRRVFVSRILEAFWFGRAPLQLTIQAESNQRRLEFARMYKPDFEILYPVIRTTREKHYPVRVGGAAYGNWLRVRYGAVINIWRLLGKCRLWAKRQVGKLVKRAGRA